MNTPIEDEKIMAIPKNKYLKVTYMLLLVSSAFGVLTSILGLFGIALQLGGLVSLLGVAGVVLALLGLFVFTEKFSAIEATHFKYMGFLFLGFIVVGILLAVALNGVLFSFVAIILNVASLALMYAGFRLLQRNTEATKENVINELKALKSSFKKS